MNRYGKEMGAKVRRSVSEGKNGWRVGKRSGEEGTGSSNLARQAIFDLGGYEMGKRPMGPEKMADGDELDRIWYGQTLEPEEEETGVLDEGGLD